MDSSLIHGAMSRATGADIHTVAGLVQEYLMADRLAEHDPDPHSTWHDTRTRIEHSLRLFLQGAPIATAMRLSNYTPHQALDHSTPTRTND